MRFLYVINAHKECSNLKQPLGPILVIFEICHVMAIAGPISVLIRKKPLPKYLVHKMYFSNLSNLEV